MVFDIDMNEREAQLEEDSLMCDDLVMFEASEFD